VTVDDVMLGTVLVNINSDLVKLRSPNPMFGRSYS
jgi:hypothetical protein